VPNSYGQSPATFLPRKHKVQQRTQKPCMREMPCELHEKPILHQHDLKRGAMG
jgi:hypothetical protein